jgi:hypothetical protein
MFRESLQTKTVRLKKIIAGFQNQIVGFISGSPLAPCQKRST